MQLLPPTKVDLFLFSPEDIFCDLHVSHMMHRLKCLININKHSVSDISFLICIVCKYARKNRHRSHRWNENLCSDEIIYTLLSVPNDRKKELCHPRTWTLYIITYAVSHCKNKLLSLKMIYVSSTLWQSTYEWYKWNKTGL